VRLTIHDAKGRRVRTLVQYEVAAGVRDVSWDLRDEQGAPVEPGIYFWRLEVAGASRAAKAAVVR
jgi:flagellar hook assembly protein FlgD